MWPLGQDVAALAAPDHQRHHGQREEDGDEDEEGELVVRRVGEHHLLRCAVGEEVSVDADDEALHLRVRPEAADALGVDLRAGGEDVILSEETQTNLTLLLISWRKSAHFLLMAISGSVISFRKKRLIFNS